MQCVKYKILCICPLSPASDHAIMRLMVTDGLASYKRAFNTEFYDYHQSCKHIADVALQESLNNVMERMHGSIREREKIMRGVSSTFIPIIPMNQIY
jgi:transposase-like protein